MALSGALSECSYVAQCRALPMQFPVSCVCRVSEDEFLAAYLMGSGSGGASRPDTAGDGAAPTRGGRGPAGLRPLGSEGSAGGGGSSITAPLGTQGGRLVSVTSVKSFGADVGGGKPGSVMAPVRPREAVAAAAVAREGPGVRFG